MFDNNNDNNTYKVGASTSSSSSADLHLIWSSKSKQTKDDEAATFLLLELYAKWADKFNDKKCNRVALWHKISEEIKKQFLLGESFAGSAGKNLPIFRNPT